ncbi:hypothetical protein [Georgenia ruanii]|uniref:hypothetical protein n=1 Tax=Georgenia ruanii TaxID=348442 RepID=UPI001263FE59|nr:hypothetical protein [Georgenia ruanii]
MLELPPAVLWDGIYGAVLSAAVAALVAVGAIYLSTRASQRSWYHQRQIESYRNVLDAISDCWHVAARDDDAYPLPSMEAGLEGEGRSRAIRVAQERELFTATDAAERSIDLWALYLPPRSGKQIELALRRALTVLQGEWRYSSYEARGTFALVIRDEFSEEWESLVTLTRRWHRVTSSVSRWLISRRLRRAFMMRPRGLENIIEDFPTDLLEGRIRLD